MRMKRVLSLLLALCLILSLIPATALPAWADEDEPEPETEEEIVPELGATYSDPTYNRFPTPEVAIFNEKSGNDKDFFEAMMGDSRFNAVEAGYFTSDSNGTLKYGTTISKADIYTYEWKGFRNTALAQLIDEYGLKVGLAATLTSNYHKHTWDVIYKDYVTSYVDVFLGTTQAYGNIAEASGKSNTSTTFRSGDRTYHNVIKKWHMSGADARPLILTIWNYVMPYDNYSKSCSCGGTEKKTTVSFYDGTAPEVKGMAVSKIIGDSSNPILQTLPNNYFGKGDTCVIELTCSEPIRFADDSKSGKGDVTIGLVVEGQANQLSAHLTKVDGNKLTFEYKLEEDGKIYPVTGVKLTGGTKPLISTATSNTGIPLKYIYGGTANKSFSVSKPSGFNETTSYITDLAGNPLKNVYIPRTLYFDSEAPRVVKATITAATNNADVKEALGKTGMDPTSTDYIDNSDMFLSEEDSFYVTLYLNEVTSSTSPRVYLNLYRENSSWQGAVNVSYCRTVDANTISAEGEYGRGASGGKITALVTEPFQISSMVSSTNRPYADGDGTIQVKSISYGGQLYDRAGNFAADYDGTKDVIRINEKYYLDVTKPTVTVDAAVQPGPINSRFYIPFTVSDEGGSGVAGLPAKFALALPNGAASKIQYAVSDSTEEPAASVWQDGMTGSALPFVQTGGLQYLHIRPVEGETYNFDNSVTSRAVIAFKVADYAGNRMKLWKQQGLLFTEDTMGMDNMPPAVRMTNSARRYNNTTKGTLTVTIEAKDISGVNSVEYQWSAVTVTDEAQLADNGWADAFGDTGASTVSVTATQTVDNGEKFVGNLWVRATDKCGISSITNLGEFSYDLESEVHYSLDFSTALLAESNIKFLPRGDGKIDLDDNGVLFIDLYMKDRGEGGTHYYRPVQQTEEANDTVDTDEILESLYNNTRQYWFTGTRTETEDGIVFTQTSTVPANTLLYTPYAGDIVVTVYASNTEQDGIVVEGTRMYDYVVTVKDSAKVESFTLHQTGAASTLVLREAAFTASDPFYVDDATAEKLLAVPKDKWNGFSDDPIYFSTLEGIQVHIDLGSDAHDWNYVDIDWDNSYIFYCDHSVYTTVPANRNDRYDAELQYVLAHSDEYRLCAIGRGPSQTITLPASDLYKSGGNQMLLVVLARHTSDQPYLLELNNGTDGIVLDMTEPGVVTPQVLLARYEYNSAGGYPRLPEKLEYDPGATIYVPWINRDIYLNADVLDAEGNPADVVNVTNRGVSGYLGFCDVIAWNVNAAPPGDDRSIWMDYTWFLEDGGSTSTTVHYNYEKRSMNLTAYTNLHGYRYLGLTPDVDNIIAMQLVYANGKTSGITYVTVHPVSLGGLKYNSGRLVLPDVEQLYDRLKLVTVDPGTAEIKYYPADGVNTAGVTLYCAPGFVRKFDGVSFVTLKNDATVLPADIFAEEFKMTPEGDHFVWKVPDADLEAYLRNGNVEDYPGIWRYTDPDDPIGTLDNPLIRIDPGEGSDDSRPVGYYVVYATDEIGNLTLLQASGYGVIADATAPLVTEKQISVDDGMFTATFTVKDDSLLSAEDRPMTLTFSYDSAYAAAAGITGNSLTLEYIQDYGTWEAETGNSLGILEVKTYLSRSGEFEKEENRGGFPIESYAGCYTDAEFRITVTGMVSPALKNATDMTLNLSVTDDHGNTSEAVGVTAASVIGKEVKSDLTKWEYSKDPDGPLWSLFSYFTAPVQPVKTWAARSEDLDHFSDFWIDAFPIWKDGDWEISYYDAFGTLYTEQITLTDLFGERGFNLGISTLDYVSDEIGVTITYAPDGDDEFFTWASYVENGVKDVNALSNFTAVKNGQFSVVRCTDAALNGDDELFIYLDNIVSGAPKATLYFYFDEFGDSYEAGSAEQPRGETTGQVVVSYQTDREVNPLGATSMTFANGDNDHFSFQYYDAATDVTYTVDGALSDYGITLVAPPEPYVDTDAPIIENVGIWKMLKGGYTMANAFPGGASDADIEKAIENSGLAQSYDFIVNASDYSKWKVVVKTEVPASMDYATAASDEIKGVTVVGNNVYVTKELAELASDFYIVVVDNAKEDTRAPADNFTCIKIPKDKYRFDTTPPEIETAEIGLDLYTKAVYVRATDKDNAGIETGACTISGAGIVEDVRVIEGVTYTHKLIFTDNTTEIPVTATDAAGNSITRIVKVTGIDVSAPTLTKTWSPCLVDPRNGDRYTDAPPAEPVNTNVAAIITSDKPIKKVFVDVNVYDEDFNTIDHDASELDPGVTEYAWGTIEFAAERITVCFMSENGVAVQLEVTAPNGKSATEWAELNCGIVDKNAPVPNDTVTPLLRSGSTVAYAEKHSISFNEDVYCLSGGTAGMIYNDRNPYELTLQDNTPRQLRFTDKAGNLLNYTVTLQDEIDNVKPTVTAEVADEADATNGSVAVTVTANEECTISSAYTAVDCGTGTMTQTTDAAGKKVWVGEVRVSENGTFRVIVSDAAGNLSDAVFTIHNVDRFLPLITFDGSIVSVRQDSTKDELDALLAKGVTAWDDVELADGTLRWYVNGATLFDTKYPAVDLSTPGVYEVPYTVEDSAGNVGFAVRYVKVIDKNQLTVSIDDKITEADSVFGIKAGTHVLKVEGLKTPNEPYKLALSKGLWSAGQMKRHYKEIEVAEDGSFTIDEPGFYTLYIVTQSRQTYRTLLHVEY